MNSVLFVLAVTAVHQPDRPTQHGIERFAPLTPAGTDSPLRKLQIARYNERLAGAKKMHLSIELGRQSAAEYKEYLTLLSDLTANAAELEPDPAGKIKWATARVELLADVVRFTEARVQAGTDPSHWLHLVTAAKLDAEIDLLKLKAGSGSAVPPLAPPLAPPLVPAPSAPKQISR